MNKLIIFDCDGTLYQQPDGPFLDSPFWQEVIEKSIDLIAETKKYAKDEAKNIFHNVFIDYGGEISRAFNERLGVSMDEYFSHTWGKIHPRDYIQRGAIHAKTLDQVLTKIAPNLAVLTNAPQPWVLNVLREIGIEKYFCGNVWTGETAIRKPTRESYLQIINKFGVLPKETLMIGDDEKLDIQVPLELGITTVLVNPYNKPTKARYQITDINKLVEVLK